MTKKTKKQIRNKDILKSKLVHHSVPPRMEGVVKNAMQLADKKPKKRGRK